MCACTKRTVAFCVFRGNSRVHQAAGKASRRRGGIEHIQHTRGKGAQLLRCFTTKWVVMSSLKLSLHPRSTVANRSRVPHYYSSPPPVILIPSTSHPPHLCVLTSSLPRQPISSDPTSPPVDFLSRLRLFGLHIS